MTINNPYIYIVIQSREKQKIANFHFKDIQAIINCIRYPLNLLTASALTIQFFIVLLYELYRNGKFKAQTKNNQSNTLAHQQPVQALIQTSTCDQQIKTMWNANGICSYVLTAKGYWVGERLDQANESILSLIPPSVGI